jgi:SAGA-associated factor 29
MTSQRSRAPRGVARAGTHETGEETQLWNETLERILKLEKNEARAKELRNEIFDKEASMKMQEDAGTSTKPNSLARILLTSDRAIY